MVVPVVLRGLPGTSTRNRPHGTSTSKPVVPVSYVVVRRVAAAALPGHCLAGHRLLLAALRLICLSQLEELTRLLAQLGRVLVAVRRYGVLRRGPHNLLFLTDDGQRAVGLARPATTVGHDSSHGASSRVSGSPGTYTRARDRSTPCGRP